MAIIYSYPEKTSTTGTDQVLISDSQDDKKTKYVTMQTIADYIDGEVTLQEVLQTGSSATGNTGNNWAGNMSLTQGGNIVAPQIARRFIVDVNGLTGGGSNKTAYLVGDLQIAGNGASDAGDLSMSGSFEVVGNGNISGSLNMTEGTSNIVFAGGVITSTSLWGVGIRPSAGQNIELDTGAGGNITLTGSGTADLIANMGGDIDITSTGNATFSTGTKDYLIADAVAGTTTLEGKSTYIYSRGATGSVINIGGTISNTRPDSIMSQAENIFQVKTTTGSSRFYMHGGSGVNTPGINSVSPHSFYDEIRLGGTAATFNDANGSVVTAGTAGSAGTAGQLLASSGSGAAPQWVDQDTISPSQVVQKVTNKTGSTLDFGTVVSIDPTSPNQTVPDVIRADNQSGLPAVGVVNQSIPIGQEGYITKIGLMENIPSSKFVGPPSPTPGDVVYMAGGTGFQGLMTVARPTGASSSVQNIGIVTKTNGGGTSYNVQLVAIGRTNDLPNNQPDSLFTAQANGTPISTVGILEVDVANNTVLIGDTSFNTDVDINADILTANADNGIVIKNDTAGEITINSTASDINISGTGISAGVNISSDGQDISLTTANDTKSIFVNAGESLDLNAKAPAIYVNVKKSTAGTIPEGKAVYIVSQNSGYIEVELCDADDRSKMPAFGITTIDTDTNGGQVIINGVHTFAGGTIIAPGAANDPIYVAGSLTSSGPTTPGDLILTRPSSKYAPLATSAFPDLQVVGRCIDPSSPDRVFINCVGFQAPEIFSGQFDVELWDGPSGTQINQNPLAKGYYEVNNNIVSGFFKIDSAATRALTQTLHVKFLIAPGVYLHDNNVYPPNSNLSGTALCVNSSVTDPLANANVGSISSVNGYILKQLVPASGYDIIASGATITTNDTYEFSFSYYTDK